MGNQLDLNLIKRARNRDGEAFSELIRLCEKDMYKTAFAICLNDEDAADAIGETVLVCWEKISSLRNVKYFKTWLTRILINKCNDTIRNRENTLSLDELEMDIPQYDTDSGMFKEAMGYLDEKYRIVMVLFYSEGYHTDEIAQILKVPSSTIRTRLERGRKKLAEYYA